MARRGKRDLIGDSAAYLGSRVRVVDAEQPAPKRSWLDVSDDEIPEWKLASQLLLAMMMTLLPLAAVIRGMRLESTEAFRFATISSACSVTGCSDSAMAVVGWLMVQTPMLFCVAIAWRWHRSSRAGKVLWVIATVAFMVVAAHFLTYEGGPDWQDLLPGPGSTAVLDGMTWGFGSAAAALVLLMTIGFFGSVGSRFKLRFPGGFAVLLVPILAGGVAAFLR
jgi:hypothetical protein